MKADYLADLNKLVGKYEQKKAALIASACTICKKKKV
jgi:hypothetical protein